MGSYANPGTSQVDRAENESYQFSDNLDGVFGRHTLSVGFNFFRKSEIDWSVSRSAAFGSFSTSGSDLGYQGGDSIADLVMGVVNNLNVRYTVNGGSSTAPDYNIRFPSWGMYVNDKFRINQNLTLSAGLRYELSIPAYTPSPRTAPCCAIYAPTPDGGI